MYGERMDKGGEGMAHSGVWRSGRAVVIALAVGAVAVATSAGMMAGVTAGRTVYPAASPLSAQFQGAFEAGTQAPPGGFYFGARAFDPSSMQASYDLTPLYQAGLMGAGETIAIVDSFGYPTVASNLETFSKAYGLPMMCGMPGVTCQTGMPSFRVLMFGNHQVKAPTSSSQSNPYGPSQEQSSGWIGEVALDTQWAHSIAPEANILLVVVPTAETLGVQGFPNMMNAEQYVVDHHLANVVTQSFAASEASFGSVQSLLNLRHAFITGTEAGITFMAAAGDSGTANSTKTPVGKGGSSIPYPTVQWPASDPLVTGVGGTNLCTNPATGVGLEPTGGPKACNVTPAQHDVAWQGSGGGFSEIFPRPPYQDNLPAGSTFSGDMRGVPDVAWQASCGTFVWVYISAQGIPGGYYGICGTSAASPQFAAMVSLADEMAGTNLGLINDSLYQLAASPDYGMYFNDVTVGNNQTSPSVPGYSASPGWDPVTGLGTPIAANLVPALAALGPHTTPVN